MSKKINQQDFQYNFRADNQIRIIRLLENGQQSIKDIKEDLNLSFTAVSNILNQLIEYGIVVKVDEKVSKGTKGRIPIYFKLNSKLGVTCSIDFSSSTFVVTLNDLKGNILISRSISNILFITREILDQVSTYIKEMLKSNEVKGRKLVAICVACPGLINFRTGEVIKSYRYKLDECPSPSIYFFNEFGVPTKVYNDIKIACVAEMVYGSVPKEARNYCFVRIGNNVGASLVIGNKLYQGRSGYSCEFTNNENGREHYDEEKNVIRGLWYLSQCIEKRDPSMSIKKELFRVDLDKAIKYYEENNPVFNEALYELARQNALQIIAYNDFLDLEYIVIGGPILKFKERYKQYFLENINKYCDHFSSKVIFSKIEEKLALKGLIYEATRLFYFTKLEEIASENNTNGSYNIFDSFDENL